MIFLQVSVISTIIMTSMVALVVLVVIATLIGNLNGYNLLLNAINNRNAAHKHYELGKYAHIV